MCVCRELLINTGIFPGDYPLSYHTYYIGIANMLMESFSLRFALIYWY